MSRVGQVVDGLGQYSIGQDHWEGLGKVVEESGELGTVLGKLISTGGSLDYWNDVDLQVALEDEIADLTAALSFFVYRNRRRLDRGRMKTREVVKFNTFMDWADKVRAERAQAAQQAEQGAANSAGENL